MSKKYEKIEKELTENETAFDFPMDTSKVLTEGSIILGVVHHILRPDEWLILRNIDWLQGLIHALLGAWIIGLISVIIKLIIEHNSETKIKEFYISEFWITLAIFASWVIGLIVYETRFNQRFKFTNIDRQFLVDKIDSKLRLKFKKK